MARATSLLLCLAALAVLQPGLCQTCSGESCPSARAVSFPHSWVAAKAKLGYSVSEMTADRHGWIVVMARVRSQLQSGDLIHCSQDFPELWVQNQWWEGRQVLRLGHDGSEWCVLMSRVPGQRYGVLFALNCLPSTVCPQLTL